MKNSKRTFTFNTISQKTKEAFSITAFVCLLFFIIMRLYDPIGINSYGMRLSSFLCILIFSFAIAFSRLLFNAKSLKTIFAWIINYVILAVSFFVIFSFSDQLSFDSPAEVFVGLFLFSLIYFLVIAIRFSLKKLMKKFSSKTAKNTEQPKYTKQF